MRARATSSVVVASVGANDGARASIDVDRDRSIDGFTFDRSIDRWFHFRSIDRSMGSLSIDRSIDGFTFDRHRSMGSLSIDRSIDGFTFDRHRSMGSLSIDRSMGSLSIDIDRWFHFRSIDRWVHFRSTSRAIARASNSNRRTTTRQPSKTRSHAIARLKTTFPRNDVKHNIKPRVRHRPPSIDRSRPSIDRSIDRARIIDSIESIDASRRASRVDVERQSFDERPRRRRWRRGN